MAESPTPDGEQQPYTVVAVDPGYRNLAICVATIRQSADSTEVRFNVQLVDVIPNKANPTSDDLFIAYRSFCIENAPIFRAARRIVVETQMHSKFIMLGTILRTLYFDTVVMLHPRTLIATFRLPTKRAPKKKATHQLVEQLYPGLVPRGGTKVDDICDSVLMAHWAAFVQK